MITKQATIVCAPLPAHQPGVIITVSLADWPAYMQQHGLAAMSLGEISEKIKCDPSLHRPSGVVWVKRQDEEGG